MPMEGDPMRDHGCPHTEHQLPDQGSTRRHPAIVDTHLPERAGEWKRKDDSEPTSRKAAVLLSHLTALAARWGHAH